MVPREAVAFHGAADALALVALPSGELTPNAAFRSLLGEAAHVADLSFADALLAEADRAESFALRPVLPDGRCLALTGKTSTEAGQRWLVLSLRDVTEEERARRSLAESEAQFRRLVEGSRDVISRIGVDGTRIYATPSIRDQLGYSQDEIAGTSPFTQFHPDEVPRLREAMQRLLRTGQVETLTYRNRRKDGRYIWAETICSPIRDPATGQVVEILTNTRDVSERVEAEAALRAAKDRYQVIADASIDMISCHDSEGNYLYASPAARWLIGVPPETLVGRNAFEFVHPDDHPVIRDALGSVLLSDAPIMASYRIRRTDGSVIATQSVAQRRRSADGTMEIQVSTRDMTPLRQVEQRVRELDAFNHAVLSTVRALVVVLDRKGRIALFNRACEELTGFREAEIRGQEFFDLLVPEDQREGTRNVFAELAAGMFPNQHANDWLTREGGRRWIEWVNSCILDDQGDVSFVVGTGIDRTAQRLAEAERTEADLRIRELNATLERRVKERTSELEAINRELETFSYSVSHDLRAPLRAIGGFSQLLLDEQSAQLEAEGKMFLDRIVEATGRMSELIDDLLTLSRSTRATIERVDVDLSATARDILDLLARAHPDRVVEVEIEPDLAATADAALARTVLENLLGNAWKYTSKKPRARIAFRRVDGGFVVEDNGAGFDMQFQDKLFGAFQRLHLPSEFEGNGIGLATVQRIVVRHGGFVRAWGKVDEGAVFTFSFGP